MSNRSQYTLQIHHPDECPKCKGHHLEPTSEYEGEYHQFWIRMVCRDCHHQWSEVYQLDA